MGLTLMCVDDIGVTASRRSVEDIDNSVEGIPIEIVQQAEYMSGVPVYNYHKAHDAINGTILSSTREQRREQQVDWMLVFRDGHSDRHIQDLCDGLPSSAACLWKGNPDKGGVPASVVRCTEPELETILQSHPYLEFVEPDQPMSLPPDETENDDSPNVESAQSIPWGLDRINAREGLDGFYGIVGGEGVHVYVLDTGIRATHQEFGGRVVPTLDVVGHSLKECSPHDKSCAHDRHGHGTHCAGTIGGSSSGVAPLSTLHAVKVFDNNGRGNWAWYLQALDYVASKGKRPAIVSASLGGQSRGRVVAVKKFIDKAVVAGVPVVVAAGNQNQNACDWTPGFAESAIIVASTTRYDHRSRFSNTGPCIDIFAPGSRIRSASNKGDTAFMVLSGTSMACPHVSGAAALLLAEKPTMTPAAVVSALQERATRNVLTDIGIGAPDLFLYVPAFVSGRIHWAARPDKCLDLSNGNNVEIWDCIDGSPNQSFHVRDGFVAGPIVPAGSPSKCLEVLSEDSGKPINISSLDCKSDLPSQVFTVPSGGPLGHILWAARPNKCLDVTGGSPSNGNSVVLSDCETSHPNMMFYFNASRRT